MRYTVVLALALVAIGCGGNSQPPAPGDHDAKPLRVQANADFTLAPGDEASIDDGRLIVRFLAVESDSRCPVDVQCVWQGDAAIALKLAPRDSATRIDTIHTTLEPRVIDVGGYELHLVKVAPDPRSSSQIPADAYRVTFRAESGG